MVGLGVVGGVIERLVNFVDEDLIRIQFLVGDPNNI